MWPIVFTTKWLPNADICCRSTKREVLGILHGLEKFHHYCFICEVSVNMDHKPLVAIFEKDLLSISLRLQRVLQLIQHQDTIQDRATNIHYRLAIQTQSQTNGEILGMHITINVIVMHSHIRWHESRRNKDSSSGRWMPQCIDRVCISRFVMHKG